MPCSASTTSPATLAVKLRGSDMTKMHIIIGKKKWEEKWEKKYHIKEYCGADSAVWVDLAKFRIVAM